jgi:Interleukin-like EMT inducer
MSIKFVSLKTLTACLVKATSWGKVESTLQTGNITLNGIATVSRTRRGFNIIQLDVCTCSRSSYRTFDTFESGNNAGQSTALANYIKSLPYATVLVGVTADEASVGLTYEAKNALLSIGVDVSELRHRGFVSFVAQVGRPEAAFKKLQPNPSVDVLVLTVNVRRAYFNGQT